MLSSLATYLFGGQGPDPEAAAATAAEQLQETELKSQDGDDWILIDAQAQLQPQPRSRSVSSSDMSASSSYSDAGALTDDMPSDEEPPRVECAATPPPTTSQPSVPERPPSAPTAPPRKSNKRVEQPRPSQPARPTRAELAEDQELPAVEVPSPRLPGPRSYAQIAAMARPATEAPKAKVPPPAPKLPQIVAAQPAKKKSNNRNPQGTMEGSWFVTPPPCFTRPNTFMMESSPLEDALIEHPSISVYSPRSAPFRVEFTDSPMTASQSSSADSPTRSPTPPPVIATSSSTTPAQSALGKTGAAVAELPAALVAARAKLRRPQLQREPLAELVATGPSGNVVLRPVRSERKSRKQSKKEAREAEKRAIEQRKLMHPEEYSKHAGECLAQWQCPSANNDERPATNDERRK